MPFISVGDVQKSFVINFIEIQFFVHVPHYNKIPHIEKEYGL